MNLSFNPDHYHFDQKSTVPSRMIEYQNMVIERYYSIKRSIQKLPNKLIRKTVALVINVIGYAIVMALYPLIARKLRRDLVKTQQIIQMVPSLPTDELQQIISDLRQIEMDQNISFKELGQKLNATPFFISPIADPTSKLLKEIGLLIEVTNEQIDFDKKLMQEALNNDSPIGVGFEFLPEFE